MLRENFLSFRAIVVIVVDLAIFGQILGRIRVVRGAFAHDVPC